MAMAMASAMQLQAAAAITGLAKAASPAARDLGSCSRPALLQASSHR